MKSYLLLLTAMVLAPACLFAADPALTVYNQNFAVVRDSVSLDLKAGVNTVAFSGTTAHVEPESVILRDPTGQIALQILEQNYRNDPISQSLLLFLNEGKTIEFEIIRGDQREVVSGKVIRSGYTAHSQQAMRRYGQRYAQSQMALASPSGGGGEPIIEINGKLHFGLPGRPIFPALGDDTILKPTLTWQLQAVRPVKLDAELAYVTGGMSWEADYNVITPEQGDALEFIGWVTIDNQSGKTFPNARINLMAGDVSKLQDPAVFASSFARSDLSAPAKEPAVTEKAFDEYHLYTLQRPTTLRDRETKQVEFVRAGGVKAQRIYIYDGAKIDWPRFRNYNPESLRTQPDYGTRSNPKVWVMQEFKNNAANGLGIPLPKGRLRFYRRNGPALEFTGENAIDHTPKDELVRVYTGNAFDLAGERRRTNFKVDNNRRFADESFEIKVRNHKKEPVEIRVVEHLYRWTTWEITNKSHDFVKTDAQTMEFRLPLKPDEEKVVTYTVHYTW
ncbi:MAG: hypothetical protein M3463_00575 [Verrucomicrobiota bacterium]|nr:hypothetical protein [Verrucomicrobiota bacterium]